MARPRRGALKNDAGNPGVVASKSTKTKYTSAVKSSLQSRMASMSLSPPPPPTTTKVEKRAQSAAHEVFNTPDLLAMILAQLPLHTERNALLVCKSFSQCTHPRAERHLYGIKEALGIKHSQAVRSITDLSGSQQRELRIQPRLSQAERHPRLDWLLNIEFEDNRPPNMLRQRSVTFLEIAPFIVGDIRGSVADGSARVYLKLKSEDVENDLARKGVGKLRNGEHEQYSNRARNGVRYSFLDIKVLKVPLNLRVAIRVDFCKAMQASKSHAMGPCPIPGCQVGLYGRQQTIRDFTPQEATLEEFFAYLDVVEHDVNIIKQEITGTTEYYGRRPHGEAYYMGAPSKPPPTIKARYGREYIPYYELYGRGNSGLKASVQMPGFNEFEASLIERESKASEERRRRFEEARLDVGSAVVEEKTVDPREGADVIGSVTAGKRSVPVPERKRADTPMREYDE